MEKNINYAPLSEQTFLDFQRQKIQNLSLNDRQELMEITKHQRTLERDLYKNNLKKDQMFYRQQLKEKQFQILEYDGEVIMERIAGDGRILRKAKLFAWQIKGLYRFRYESTSDEFWNLNLAMGGKEILTPRYPVEYLKSTGKLQSTVLFVGMYEMTPHERREAWMWVKNKLLYMYENAQIRVLPLLPGWFCCNNVWHFWISSADTSAIESRIISRFTAETFTSLNISDIIDELTTEVYNGSFGVLLIFRLMALLGRLTVDVPPPMRLAIVGPDAVQIAKRYLSTMASSDSCEVANVDADRINLIRKNVCELRDTVAIFVLSNCGSKSVKNRMRDILSWQDAGYLEGNVISVPFVFCQQEFSSSYLFGKTVTIMTEDIKVEKTESFAKLQNFLVQSIESGSGFWVKKFAQNYEKVKEKRCPGDDEPVLWVGRAVTETVMKILDLDEERNKKMSEFFDLSFMEIQEQMNLSAELLINKFKDGIVHMADSGEIHFCTLREAKFPDVRKIYFDSDFYYFRQGVLDIVIIKLKLDRKSLHIVKQELAENGYLKQYRETGFRRSEFNIDVIIGEGDDRKKISVIAIGRNFWDETGGIALYERDERDGKNLV